MDQAPGDITALIRRWGSGDQAAADVLFPLIYAELRRMAGGYFRGEGPGHILQPTALVHELFLTLDGSRLAIHDRRHFYAIAAGQMRRLLVDHARAANAAKRGGDMTRVHSVDIAAEPNSAIDVLDLENALAALGDLDARVARGVELRYFAGLSESDAAEALGISVATLKRDWQFARAWLRARLAAS